MFRVPLKNLPCNTPAILQFTNKTIDGVPVKVHTRVVGVASESSVMVSWDDNPEWAGVQDVLNKDEPVILRVVDSKDAKGRMLALKTYIRLVLYEPSRIVFLDYPNRSDVQLAEIRKGSRIKVDIPGVVIDTISGKAVGKGKVSDISKSGCGFQFENNTNPEIDKGLHYRIMVRHETAQATVNIEPKKVEGDNLGGLFVSERNEVAAFIKLTALIFVNRELLS